MLDIQSLTIGFQVDISNKRIEKMKKRIANKKSEGNGFVKVVDDFQLQIQQGEIVGIVGESGSGKTMTALAIMGLLSEEAKILSGKIMFLNKDILTCSNKVLREFQGNHMSMIFQEPMTSLNPVYKIGRQVEEPMKIHGNFTKGERKQKALDILREVEIQDPEKVYYMYPHELSGGMRQRVMIGMALICEPKLLIADEPTTALDVTIQAQIIKLLQKINKNHKTSILFISHNLGVVKQLCNRVLVMHEGIIVEQGLVEDVFNNSQEKYTKTLIASIPTRKSKLKQK